MASSSRGSLSGLPDAETRGRNFAGLFASGTNTAIVGGRGSGKSWTASGLASCGLDHGYLVASNILCKRWVPAEDDPASGTWAEAYPRGYSKVGSYFELFQVIERALRANRSVLFVLDEAGALVKSLQKGETSLQSHVRDSIAYMAVARHLRVATLVLSQSLENLGVAFRSFEGGLLDMTISMERQGVARVATMRTDTGRTAVRTIDAYGLAHGEDWAREKPGRTIYSDSVASFDRGAYPGTKTEFRLRELLDALSDELPDRYPDIIREHLEGPPAEGIEAAAADEQFIPRILELHAQGKGPSEIARELGCGKQWASKVIKRHAAAGA